jgi:acyl-CoA thioesterase
MHGRDAVARNLDVVLEDARAGYARVSMRVRDHMLNAHGTVHGGYSFILADIAFGYASNSRGRMAFAQSAQITYMTFGRPDEVLTAVAEEKGTTDRTGLYDATVYGGDGRVVAEFRGFSRTVKGQVDT